MELLFKRFFVPQMHSGLRMTPGEYMESLGKIAKLPSRKDKANPHLHSPAHLLADELCQKLNDKKHFAFYLKMAVLYNHDFLRNLAGQIMENKNAKTPGRLFAYLIKKNNQEKKAAS